MDLVDLNGMWPEWAKTVVKVGAAVALTAAGAVVAGGTSWVNQAVDNGIENVNYKKMGLDAASGAIKAIATIAVTGGTVGLGSKVLLNGIVDVGEKVIESNLDGQEVTAGEIALTAGESIFSTVLFHSADKLLSGAKSGLHEYISHKQNAWDAKWWILARNLTASGIGVSDINNAFKNLSEGCEDFYEYELVETLRKYIVQSAVKNDKSLIRNEILGRLNLTPSDLLNKIIESLKASDDDEKEGACESEY